MVRPKPNNDAGRLLALIVASRGELDLDALAVRMWPAPVLRSTAAYLAWRREYAAWEGTPADPKRGIERVVGAREMNRAVVSRLLGRLREAGYVETGRGAPRVAEDVPTPFTAADWRRRWAALEVCDGEVDGDDYDPASGETAGGEAHAAMVARIRDGAASVVEAVGTSGSAWVVYGQLVRAEVVIPPGRPVASAKGEEVVAGWRVQS